jgi:hypothetical protein
MFHPIGSKPAVVYWRRRLLLVGLVVLVGLTMYVACSSGSSKPAAEPTSPTPTAAQQATHAASSASTTKPSGAASTLCAPAALKISAVTSTPKYKVGVQPSLELQVVNTGPRPCVQDLADSKIELQVYNGESRVWGSHDCKVEPGTSPQMLAVGTAVRRSILWTGLSSQPKCAGQRVRVGPGTYTLHALLAGRAGTTAQFTIS